MDNLNDLLKVLYDLLNVKVLTDNPRLGIPVIIIAVLAIIYALIRSGLVRVSRDDSEALTQFWCVGAAFVGVGGVCLLIHHIQKNNIDSIRTTATVLVIYFILLPLIWWLFVGMWLPKTTAPSTSYTSSYEPSNRHNVVFVSKSIDHDVRKILDNGTQQVWIVQTNGTKYSVDKSQIRETNAPIERI